METTFFFFERHKKDIREIRRRHKNFHKEHQHTTYHSLVSVDSLRLTKRPLSFLFPSLRF